MNGKGLRQSDGRSNRTLELPLKLPAGSILVDNSSYFSFRIASQEGNLNAQIVYNLANFLECLVLAERVYLAPTTAWKPNLLEEKLFCSSGPCAQIKVENWSANDLGKLFLKAVRQGIVDLEIREVRERIGFGLDSLQKTKELLASWVHQVEDDPAGFLETYSGAVFWTDTASTRFLSKMRTAVDKSMPTYRHLGHYLLRTNVVLELSSYLPYHPHSHRVNFVSKKMELANKTSEGLAAALLREAEANIDKKICRKIQSTFLSYFGGFQYMETDLPLILSVVLAGANKPSDLLDLTLELRGKREAKRYRQWIGKLLDAIDSRDYDRQVRAEQELQEARRVLNVELGKLYDKRKGEVVGRISKVAGVVDPEKISTLNLRGLAVDIGKNGLKYVDIIEKKLRDLCVKRNILFLLNMAKERKDIVSLNSMLKRVFGSELPADEIEVLHSLRVNQKKIMDDIIKDDKAPRAC